MLRGLGIQTSSSSSTYLSTATTRFIPTNMIQDIFIHEAFKGFEVRFYLAVVVEGEEEVVVVFPVRAFARPRCCGKARGQGKGKGLTRGRSCSHDERSWSGYGGGPGRASTNRGRSREGDKREVGVGKHTGHASDHPKRSLIFFFSSCHSLRPADLSHADTSD